MEKLKHLGILILGWFMVALGIVGLFLPILQGILFLMIGLIILSTRSETVKRWMAHLEARYPRHYERALRWTEKLKSGWKNLWS
jgi:uncharacterized protein